MTFISFKKTQRDLSIRLFEVRERERERERGKQKRKRRHNCQSDILFIGVAFFKRRTKKNKRIRNFYFLLSS